MSRQVKMYRFILLMCFSSVAISAQIAGHIKQTVIVDSALNLADGSNVLAIQNLAVINNGARVNGSFSQTVHVKNVVNMAIGNGSSACQSLVRFGGENC